MLQERLVTFEQAFLEFYGSDVIKSPDMIKLAGLPIRKMKWEISTRPNVTISNEDVWKVVENIVGYGKEIHIDFRDRQPKNFHKFLVKNFGTLVNKVDRRFLLRLHFFDTDSPYDTHGKEGLESRCYLGLALGFC